MRIRLGSAIIEYPPLGETEAERIERIIAEQVAADLLIRADGMIVTDPETWLMVARGMGCTVLAYQVDDGPPGEYSATRAGSGVIVFNAALPRDEQARTLVHELAHHGQVKFGYVLPMDSPSALRYVFGDLLPLRHRVARRVERLVFGEAE